jgi:hypothetical protein
MFPIFPPLSAFSAISYHFTVKRVQISDVMLCESCRGFDVRSLLYAAKLEESRLQDGSYSAVSKFYAHHGGLSALKSSSEGGCDMCRLLWSTACDTLKKEQIDRWLETGEGEHQIYLGTSQWSPMLQGLPYVVVTQHPSQQGPWVGSRTLGLFEVYAERGMRSFAI